MKLRLVLLAMAVAAGGLGAERRPSPPQRLSVAAPGYSAIAPAISRALSSGAAQSWRGDGASGYVSPLGQPVSSATGERCSLNACTNPCQSYIVSYETVDFETAYRGYACRSGLNWGATTGEGRTEAVTYKTKPAQDTDKNTATADADAKIRENNKRITDRLVTLRYVANADAPLADRQDAFKTFLADEQATASNGDEAVVLLDAAIARSQAAGCPEQALAAKAALRACAIVRSAG